MNRIKRVNLLFVLSPFIKKHKITTIFYVAYKTIFYLFNLIIPIIYSYFINNVLFDKETNNLSIVILSIIFIYFFQTFIIKKLKYYENKFCFLFRLHTKKVLLKNCLNMPMCRFEQYEIGDLKNIIEDDFYIIENFFGKYVLDYSLCIFISAIIFIRLLHINLLLTLFATCLICVSLIISKIISGKIEYYSNQYRNHFGEYEGYLYNVLARWREIKANQLENYSVLKLSSIWKELSRNFIRLKIYNFFHGALVAFNMFVVTKMSLYFVGGILVLYDLTKVSTVLIFIAFFESFFVNINNLVENIGDYKKDTPKIIKFLNIIRNERYTYFASCLQNIQTMEEIKIHNVSFRYYNSSKNVLNNITLNINCNQHIAIVGESGSGKSTLVKILLGLYKPTKGEILIGKNNIFNFPYDDYNKIVTAVMQEPQFFNLSIIENLKLANHRATNETIKKACQMACVDSFVSNFPEGYKSVIGENGIKLSGGQKQRLAIARAIISGAKVIIFDEATSAVDNESEKNIMQAIHSLSKNHIIITVAHKLDTIVNADQIVVLKSGRIVSQGKFQTLNESSSEFNRLFNKD